MGLTVILLSDGSDGRGEPPSLAFDAPRLVIGRGDGCEVRLPDPSVSSRHATLRQHGGTYLIVDEGSTNGTFIGDVRLSAHAPRVVSDGDRIRVGRVWLELRLTVVATSSSPHDTRELALGLVQRALEQQGEDAAPRLRIVAGPDAGLTLPLPRSGTPVMLGRGHGVDLSLDEPDASRRHLQITRKADQVWLRDLGSKNGTVLGDRRLTPERDTLWRASDTLSIGQDILVFEHPALEALAELERCADEPLPPDAALQAPADIGPTPPPSPSPAPVLEPSPSPSNESSPPSSRVAPLPSPATGGAPIVPVPRVSRAPSAVSKGGWGAGDLLVLVIALALIGLSLGGLWFVFR